MEFPKSLVGALRARRVIPFAGAGIAMAVRRRHSGDPAFPSWIGLLRQAAQELRDEQKCAEADFVESCLSLGEPKVLEAAQTARDGLRAGWPDFLVRVFRLRRKQLSDESLEGARLIWNLGSNLVVTTNFDNILEWASPDDYPITWNIQNVHGHAQFMRGEHDWPTVWHIHGHIYEPDRIVITPDGYTPLYGDKVEESQYEAALTTFRNILASHTILFVGFSFQDKSVNSQLTWLEHAFHSQAGRHFALIRSEEIPLFKERGALKNVEPIPYEEHGEPFLARLREMARIVDPDFGSPVVVAPRPTVEWPADIGVEMPESFLLRPENCIVPFHEFQYPLLQAVLDWALAGQPRVALRLQVGPVGSGKTRLMIEASRRLQAEHGWECDFHSSAPDELPKLEASLASGKNCFVVVDYAETRPSEVIALARATLGERCTGKVRIALLARNAGPWWERLADGTDGVLKSVLDSPRSKTGPYRIEEQVPADVRPAVFEEALTAFARAKGVPVPDHGCPDLAGDPFGEVLFIHLAALANLRGQAANER